MHVCLNVIEILTFIACELVASGGKASAVGLACCCKSFEDPVLDALWETQDGLLPLFESFPRDVWDEGGCTVSVPTTSRFFSFPNNLSRKSFKRLPTTMEWARFRKYARRVRELEQHGIPETLSLRVLSVIQLYIANEPLLPNLKTLRLREIEGSFIPFIPLFLSPRTTSIYLGFESDPLRFESDSKAMVASMVTTLPTLCPYLESIVLQPHDPRDPMITAAVSGMLLVTNRNTLQLLHTHSPLTEEASEVVYKLPNLRELFVVIERGTSLSSASLPNLTTLSIVCDNEGDWPQLFHGAMLGNLESVVFGLQSEQIGDFLGAFGRAALPSSIQNTLKEFILVVSCSWNPDYSSLLPFTQMEHLDIDFFCGGGCSSRVDDDIIINISRAMPKLKTLKLGNNPCRQSTTGITAKGLVALAHHCPGLSTLRVHFQVASLNTTPAILGMIPKTEPNPSWADCALTTLIVGEIPVPEQSVLMVALTLLRIFPRLNIIYFIDERWEEVENAIRNSKQIVDCLSEPSLHLESPSMIDDPSTGATFETGS
jgi:hypothetical protein